MGKMHEIMRDYPVDVETLWNDILDLDALADSMRGVLTYEGFPTEPAREGQTIDVKIKRWGWLPIGSWIINVVRRDDQNHILESREHGSLVRCFKHRLEIVALDKTNTRYTDYLDIDAGIFTNAVFPIICKMYEDRQDARRQRLVAC